jgi:hypothetical protein
VHIGIAVLTGVTTGTFGQRRLQSDRITTIPRLAHIEHGEIHLETVRAVVLARKPVARTEEDLYELVTAIGRRTGRTTRGDGQRGGSDPSRIVHPLRDQPIRLNEEVLRLAEELSVRRDAVGPHVLDSARIDRLQRRAHTRSSTLSGRESQLRSTEWLRGDGFTLGELRDVLAINRALVTDGVLATDGEAPESE